MSRVSEPTGAHALIASNLCVCVAPLMSRPFAGFPGQMAGRLSRTGTRSQRSARGRPLPRWPPSAPLREHWQRPGHRLLSKDRLFPLATRRRRPILPSNSNASGRRLVQMTRLRTMHEKQSFTVRRPPARPAGRCRQTRPLRQRHDRLRAHIDQCASRSGAGAASSR
jgi:hypothetical protein